MRLLLRTAAFLLRTDLAGVADEVFLGAANRLLGEGEPGLAGQASLLCASAFGGITPSQYFIAALLSPLLYGFGVDGDGVNDNAGRIPGYGAGDRGIFVSQRVSYTLRKLIFYFGLIFSALF